MSGIKRHATHPSLTDLPIVCDELGDRIDVLEGHLLRLDHGLRCGEDPSEQVLLLLRHAHSVKGTLGLARMNRLLPLLHSFESLFVAVRDHRLRLDHLVLDVGLLTVDMLRDACTRGDDEGAEAGPVLARIGALLRGGATQSKTAGIPFQLSSGEAILAKQAVLDGQALYIAHKIVETNISSGIFTTLPIWETLQSLGRVVAHRPLFSEIDRAKVEFMLTILFATTLTETEVARQVFDAFYRVSWSADGGRA